jgi:hypothetical protein
MLEERQIFVSGWERLHQLAGMGWAEWDLAGRR